ncbi:MAG: type II secretion system F family protein [Coriobacteriales bacterium]|jgi:tight adherence protein C|nr:type II secretion system F family protein [Coriobacteriales bacterium]
MLASFTVFSVFSVFTVVAVFAIFMGAYAAFLFAFEGLCAWEKVHIQKSAKRRLGAFKEKGDRGGRVEGFLSKTPFASLFKRREEQRSKVSFERDLPALIEVVALGMRAGMGFDQSFALYTERFETPLAYCCQEALTVWQKGLESREEGMRQLAERIGTPSFRHFCSSVLRALRFGAPMTQLLLDLAQEARKEYRARRQELVAKAPVKMLLPTGVLILPAMLLLVMGPIILDLMRKMG